MCINYIYIIHCSIAYAYTYTHMHTCIYTHIVTHTHMVSLSVSCLLTHPYYVKMFELWVAILYPIRGSDPLVATKNIDLDGKKN